MLPNSCPWVRCMESVLRELIIGLSALFGKSRWEEGRDVGCYVCMHVTVGSNAITCYSHLGNAIMSRGQFASRLCFEESQTLKWPPLRWKGHLSIVVTMQSNGCIESNGQIGNVQKIIDNDVATHDDRKIRENRSKMLD